MICFIEGIEQDEMEFNEGTRDRLMMGEDRKFRASLIMRGSIDQVTSGSSRLQFVSFPDLQAADGTRMRILLARIVRRHWTACRQLEARALATRCCQT